jgi:putative ABC transport system permease protein
MRTTWALAVAGLRGRRITTSLVLVAVVAIAALGIVSGPLFVDQSERAVDTAAADAHVADVVVNGPAPVLAEVGGAPQVAAASTVQPTVDGEVRRDGEPTDVSLAGLDDPEQPVGRPAGLQGRWLDPARDDQVVLDRSGARALGLEVGDTLDFIVQGRRYGLVVVGTAVDLTDCFAPSCNPVRGWTSAAAVQGLAGPEPRSQVLLGLEDPAAAEAVAAELLAQHGADISTETWTDTRGDLLAAEQVFGAMLGAVGIFLLVASCVVLAGSLVARVAARRRELGLYKALGAAPAQVTAGLALEHLALAAVGVLVGWLLASLLAPLMKIGVTEVIDGGGVRFDLGGLLVAAVVVGLLVTVATLVPAIRAGREPATEVVRDAPSAAPGAFARLAGKVRTPALALGLHGAVARPLRTTISALALLLAVVGAVVSASFVQSVDDVLADPGRTGDPWDAEVEPADGVAPDDVEQVLAADPLVQDWFTETDRRSTLDGETFLSQAIGGPGTPAFVVQEGRAPSGPGEAMAGYGFLERFGVDLGDQIDIEAGGLPLSLRIVGWYTETADNGEVVSFTFADLQVAQPGVEPGRFQVVAEPGVRSSEVTASLQAAFGADAQVTPVVSGDGSVGQEEGSISAVKGVAWAVAALVVGVALAFLVATLAAGARERARELGVVRALGTSARAITLQESVGALPQALLAVVVGLPLGAWLFTTLMDAAMSGAGLGPGFVSGPGAGLLLVVGAAVLLVTVLLALLAAVPLARRPISELVRWE